MAKDKTAPWNMGTESEEKQSAASGLVPLHRTKAEKKKDKEGMGSLTSKDSGPDYPYGLSFELRDESLKKLGLDSLPEVGETMCIYAEVEVIRTSQRAGKDSKDREIGFQIKSLRFDEPDSGGQDGE